MLQRKRLIIANILLILFAFYYANISFFYHSHILTGRTIWHSHLHDTNHAKSGTHSENELSLISVLSHFQSLQAALCLFGIGLFLLFLRVFRMDEESKPVSTTPLVLSLRAPPALF
ncbi:hypothetical protein LJC52_01470 [Bacteroidales bacterium OttesenSCG-928-A17]|nr:hypothetical protein [Bacteroidales bacterium OttesenSCG-928-A17]